MSLLPTLDGLRRRRRPGSSHVGNVVRRWSNVVAASSVRRFWFRGLLILMVIAQLPRVRLSIATEMKDGVAEWRLCLVVAVLVD